MKRGFDIYIFIIICILTTFIPGCVLLRPPDVITSSVSFIGPTSATGGGRVTGDGNSAMIARGVCWSTKKSPDVEDPHTTDGYEIGEYISNITGLTPNTLYHVRAYASNVEGTSYGKDLTFTTSPFGIPELTTKAVTGITQTTAVSGGENISDGGEPITEKGVCWSTQTGPDISDSKTNNGDGTGSFTSNITGLTGNTTYYVRAYAKNSEGTGYGQEIMFKTNQLLAVITTTNPSTTSATTGTSGGSIASDGGSSITAKGVCWGTTSNPVIGSNNWTNNGTGTATFTSNITGLTANTTYHVRAYATNGVGTAYGEDKQFTTDPLTVSDNDGNTYDVIRIGTQVWMKQNLRTTKLNDNSPIPLVTGNSAWSNLTSSGYCWYDGNEGYKNTYGAIYNWYTVSTGKLCPAGWHVSTDNEWITLEFYLGGVSPAGGKLKETGFSHWLSPNTGATNQYGFTALPGGWRRGDNGIFESITSYGLWWTSTEYSSPDAYYRKIWYNDDKTFKSFSHEKYGMSIRCLKD